MGRGWVTAASQLGCVGRGWVAWVGIRDSRWVWVAAGLQLGCVGARLGWVGWGWGLEAGLDRVVQGWVTAGLQLGCVGARLGREGRGWGIGAGCPGLMCGGTTGWGRALRCLPAPAAPRRGPGTWGGRRGQRDSPGAVAAAGQPEGARARPQGPALPSAPRSARRPVAQCPLGRQRHARRIGAGAARAGPAVRRPGSAPRARRGAGPRLARGRESPGATPGLPPCPIRKKKRTGAPGRDSVAPSRTPGLGTRRLHRGERRELTLPLPAPHQFFLGQEQEPRTLAKTRALHQNIGKGAGTE